MKYSIIIGYKNTFSSKENAVDDTMILRGQTIHTYSLNNDLIWWKRNTKDVELDACVRIFVKITLLHSGKIISTCNGKLKILLKIYFRLVNGFSPHFLFIVEEMAAWFTRLWNERGFLSFTLASVNNWYFYFLSFFFLHRHFLH